MGSFPSCYREVTLMMVGQDGAGKTALFQHLTGGDAAENAEFPAMCEAELRLIGWRVTLIDVPGGPDARALWVGNYHRCHGLVFVINSCDNTNHSETSALLRDVILHPQVAGKPILLLFNTQHNHRAFNVDQMMKVLSLEALLRKSRSHCVMLECCTEPGCNKHVTSRIIKRGLRMHMRKIGRCYEDLWDRVQQDTDKYRKMVEQLKGAESDVKNCDVAMGPNGMSSPVMMESQRSSSDKRCMSQEMCEYGPILPGTVMSNTGVVSLPCPIIRRTIIHTGDDDTEEDHSVQITVTMESAHPWDRIRGMADELETLLRNHEKKIPLVTGETKALETITSTVVYDFAVETVEMLLQCVQEPLRRSITFTPARVPSTPASFPSTPVSIPSTPVSIPSTPMSRLSTSASGHSTRVTTPSKRMSRPCTPGSIPSTRVTTPSTPGSIPSTPGSIPSTPGSIPSTRVSRPCTPGSIPSTPGSRPSILAGRSSQVSSEMFEEALRFVSIKIVDKVLNDLSLSSQANSTDARGNLSVSLADEQEDSLNQAEPEKRGRKPSFFPHLRELAQKSKKRKQLATGQPEKDKRTPEGLNSASNDPQMQTGHASGSQVREKPAKRSMFARALSSVRKGIRNIFIKKN